VSQANRARRLQEARGLERRGQLDAAYSRYLEVGAVDEAARILALRGRHAEAGRLLFTALRVETQQVHQLQGEKRKLALKAAIYFARAGEANLSAAIFVQLGERGRAADVLERAGDGVAAAKLRSGAPADLGTSALPAAPGRRTAERDGVSLPLARRLEQEGKLELAMQTYVELGKPTEAARVARKLKRFAEAANLLLEAGQPFEAAACRLEGRDLPGFLDAVMRVPRDHPRYRDSCRHAVRAAADLGELGFQLEHFISGFIRSGPLGDAELETFYLLGRLYMEQSFPENAREVFAKVQAARPGYRDAVLRLAELEDVLRGSEEEYRRVVEEDDAFRIGSSAMGAPHTEPVLDFPDLPELPQADEPPAVVGRPVTRDTSPPTVAHEGPGRGLLEVGGSLAGGRYRLLKLLGEGGVAIVFKARDEELDEEIAIKVFTRPTAQESLVTRFKEELKFSRQLTHPNIIRLYDFGVDHGHRYITMELLEGTDLQEKLGRPLDLDLGLHYLIQACNGLHAAHEQGAIHRDVKPSNMFVLKDETLKIMDFGIAKWRRTAGLTQEGSIAGTPEYMSPEQIHNFSGVTQSTDLYAIGVMAFEMFTGELPFDDEELMALLMMHAHDPPPMPSEKNPAIPENLEAVILRCLEKEPENRFASCAALANALQSIRGKLAKG